MNIQTGASSSNSESSDSDSDLPVVFKSRPVPSQRSFSSTYNTSCMNNADNIPECIQIKNKNPEHSEQFHLKNNKQFSSESLPVDVDLTEDDSDAEQNMNNSECVLKQLPSSSMSKYLSGVHEISDSSEEDNYEMPSLSERLANIKDKNRKICISEMETCSEREHMHDETNSIHVSNQGKEKTIHIQTKNIDSDAKLKHTISINEYRENISSTESNIKRKKRSPEEIAESKLKAEALKAEKEKTRLEAKSKKEQEKNAKAQVREAERQRKKQLGSYKDSLQYIKLVLDTHVVNECGIGATVFKMCDSLGCKCITEDLPIPFSILWRREITDIQVNDSGVSTTTSEKTEDEVLLIIPVPDFVQMVDNFKQDHFEGNLTLMKYVETVQQNLQETNITIIVMGMEKYFRDQKTAKQREHRDAVLLASNKETSRKKNLTCSSVIVSRVDVEEALAAVQLQTDVMAYMLETAEDVAEYLRTYTKAVADKPAKAGRLESAALSFQEEKASGIKVDKSGQGLLKVWKQQIMQFKNVSPDIADAIVSVYPSPRLLMKAYDECGSQEKGEQLLENIVVRRGAGVLETFRRVGKEMSRRFHMYFTSIDPDIVIK